MDIPLGILVALQAAERHVRSAQPDAPEVAPRRRRRSGRGRRAT